MIRIEWDPPTTTDDEIERHLGDHAGLARMDRSRMSRLLCEQLVHGIVTRTIDLFAVTDVLQALEDGSSARRHVEIRPFIHPPLRGLMHAHFTQASFIPQNLLLELSSKKGQKRFDKAFAGMTGRSIEEAANVIAHEATFGMFENRAERGALTGEWIIYAEREGQRFYLALAGHTRNKQEDMLIYDRMLSRCEERFQRLVLDCAEAG
jgi:hypothetical protein